MADANQVAEHLGISVEAVAALPESLFKDGAGPLSTLVDGLMERSAKVTELEGSVNHHKGEAQKAFQARDAVKTKLRELETNGIKDDEMKERHASAIKSIATLEAEKQQMSSKLEELQSFREEWEKSTKSEVDAALKAVEASPNVSDMVKRMSLKDQLPFIREAFAARLGGENSGNGKLPVPFSGKKPNSGTPFEGFVDKQTFEAKRSDRAWMKANRENVRKSQAHW